MGEISLFFRFQNNEIQKLHFDFTTYSDKRFMHSGTQPLLVKCNANANYSWKYFLFQYLFSINYDFVTSPFKNLEDHGNLHFIID